MKLSGLQIAAAITLSGLTREALATEAGIGRNTLDRIINETAACREDTIRKVTRILEMRGVEFIDNEGVRVRPRGMHTYQGVDGFKQFLDNVYEYVKQTISEEQEYEPVCSSSVNDKDFIRHLGDFFSFHIDRMNSLRKFRHRILLKEKPSSLRPTELKEGGYREYRKRSPQDTANVPFYVYGDKLAILMIADSVPQIIEISSAQVAQAYREIFNALWLMAEPFE